MSSRRNMQRYREIVGVLVDEGLDNLLQVTGLRRFAPVSTLRSGRSLPEQFPQRLRRTLERLGPAFVKLGQAASTRSDLIPDAVIDELRKLQDQVAPIPFTAVTTVIESEFGQPVDLIFTRFDEEPLASASLGQVHRAELADGKAVAVKVQRPGVRRVVETDLDILITQARFVEQRSELGQQYDIVGIAEEFASAVRSELDYIAEAENAEHLGTLFAEDPTVVFPGVHWPTTTERVLTLDLIEGVPMNRVDLLDEAGFDRAELAKRGIFAYLEMIFVHGLFHADPHPGNLFALPDGRVAFTDFGRVGAISEVGRNQLADLFVAIIDNDVGLAVDTLVTAAGSPGEISVPDLEREVSRLVTKYYNKSLAEVHVGELIGEVLKLVRNHHLILPGELAMLLATLTVLEGMGTQLDPEFDFVNVTAPYARRLMDDRLNPGAIERTALSSLRRISRMAIELPDAFMRFMRRAGSGEFRVAIHPTGLEPVMRRFEEAVNRLAFAVVVAAFVIGLSTLLDNTPLPPLFVWTARIAWAGAVGVGSWYFISIFLARRRKR